ncbi:hypothetical protein EMCRGX_G003059 [Ephydatia muelleri]
MVGKAVLFVVAIAVSALSSPVDLRPLKQSTHVVRSNPERSVACYNDTDCYPATLKGSAVPTEYIKCENYSCICSSNCFKTSGSTCEYSVCGQYDNATHNCTTTSDLKDQKTAFLLSLFLSSIGAANFYIGRNELAIPQLVMSVVMVATPLLLLCICCCALECSDTGGHMGGMAVQCILGIMGFVSIVPLIIAVLLALITIAWWIADLVIFVNNERTDGSGCALTANL